MLQEEAQLGNGELEFLLHEVVDVARVIELFLASVDELLNFILGRVRADDLLREVSNPVSHHDGFFTSNLVMLIPNGHVMCCRSSGVHDGIKLTLVGSHPPGLRSDVPVENDACAVLALHPVRHAAHLLMVVGEVGGPRHCHDYCPLQIEVDVDGRNDDERDYGVLDDGPIEADELDSEIAQVHRWLVIGMYVCEVAIGAVAP